MKPSFVKYLLVAIVAIGATSCDDDNPGGSLVDATLNEQILQDFSSNVAQASYNDLRTKAAQLYTSIETLAADGGQTTPNLEACRSNWKAARAAWEQTESFLFGPVSTEDVDPRIDTWPVDFNVLQAQLDGDSEFTPEYIDNLLEDQKGFHAIEYLIFGVTGSKTAGDITEREREYLVALGQNLKNLTTLVAAGWDPFESNNYHELFVSAGDGNAPYETQQDAFAEMVSAMAGICDEVANGKINEVYEAKDPSLEESPFSKNSITDFTNNMIGVRNVYLGKYSTDGKGLEDLVKKYNLQLDGEIKAAIDAAISALASITDPFGTAINTQSVQVENAVDAINALKDILDDGNDANNTDLAGFVMQHTN
jgi:predicted lipoprotein